MSNSSLDVGYGVGSAAEDQIADIPRKCETVDCKISCEEFIFLIGLDLNMPCEPFRHLI